MQHIITRRKVLHARGFLALSLTAAVLQVGVASIVHAAPRLGAHTVALSGTSAPAGLGTITAVNYSGPTISPSGTVVFPGQLNNNATGIFAGTYPQSLQLVMAQYQQAPGAPGVFLTGTTSPPITVGGQIAALGVLLDNTFINANNDEGVWIGYPGAATLIAREGTPAPYPPGDKFGSLRGTFSNQSPVINDSGQVAFQMGVQNSAGVTISNAAVDWISYGGILQTVAATGGPAVGAPAGATLTTLGSPGLTSTGQVLYSGGYSTPHGITGSGIWLATPGFTLPIALTGQPAPGLPGDTFVDVGYRSTINGTSVDATQFGATTFFGTITGPDVQPTVNDHGVWVGDNGRSALIARQGDAAPGLPAGTTFSSFLDIGISNAGTSGVLAAIVGPGVLSTNERGLWVGTPGNMHLLLREGDTVADGAGAPLMIKGLTHFTMNATGEVLVQLTDGSLVGTNHVGQLTIVARMGDQLEVAPGDFRTIQFITALPGGETAGGPTALNDQGVVAFAATFTDGTSGAFYSSALAVPEPGTCALALMSVLGVVVLRRRLRRLL